MPGGDNGASIIGVGNTRYSRKADGSAELLAIEAVLAAAADAGIDPRQIDGIIPYPGHVGDDVIQAELGLSPRFRTTVDMGGCSAVSALRIASMAVMSGAARHVLLFRGLKGSSGARKADRPSFLPGQPFRRHLEHVYGINTPAQRYAVLCQRYKHEYGLDRRTLGEIAIAARAHANLNPGAQMYGRELTMEDYLAGRLIADPYTLFDCCLETDGASAVIVSARNDGRDIRILSVAEAQGNSPDDTSNREPFLEIGLTQAANDVWADLGVGPEDMDAAMIYDCFTFEVLHQIEEAGFARHGEAATLIADGGIRLGGKLPINTHGGMLSEAHQAGLNHVVEAVRQLRGECGARQVQNARLVAVTGWGQLGDGSFAVLGGKHV
ncbi:acetyl-CoA acetyltransferase [Neorhizobium galegae]|uniref:thiolase family protein n=1 Tax=Neorhizobium TaxID=1525371 RepID=UPI0005664BBF|nr:MULTISPECIES: thiolase family protein [Neorhizobium]MBP2562298.1 acetyl-CoA acetyltransferase [Neorhizobium galegae]MDQ0138338.1 acetyl-CoA acetyltransferase [Neorhizobium galegae]